MAKQCSPKKITNVIEIKSSNLPHWLYKRISSINKLKHIKVDKKSDMFLKKEILGKFLKF